MSEQQAQSSASGVASELNALLGRCATCHHFTRYTEPFDVEYHGAHAGKCASDKFVYDDEHQPPKDGLRYWDYEGYAAGFEVGDKFGCIHWMRSNVEVT